MLAIELVIEGTTLEPLATDLEELMEAVQPEPVRAPGIVPVQVGATGIPVDHMAPRLRAWHRLLMGPQSTIERACADFAHRLG